MIDDIKDDIQDNLLEEEKNKDSIILNINNNNEEEKNPIDLDKSELVEKGYDVNYGARPLKRVVSRELETILANKLISGEVHYGETITFDYLNNELITK